MILPLSDRVFDIKQKLATLLKKPIHKIQLFVGPHFADDESRIPDLELSDQSLIRVNILPEGILRHYFRDLEGNDRVMSFPAEQKVNFGSIGPHFLEEKPMQVGYIWEGKQLKWSTLLSDIVCDPHAPIVCKRQLTLDLTF